MQYPFILIAVLIALLSVGCSSVSEAPDDSVAETGPGYGASEAYQAAAPWLPADAQVVLAATNTSVWDLLGDDLLAIAPVDGKPGEIGTTSGLRVDLENHVYEYLGFDPGLADGLVAGLSDDYLVLVVFGPFLDFDYEGEFEVAGRQAFEVEIPEFMNHVIFSMRASTSLVVMPIEEPRRGLVVAANRQQLKAMIEAEDGTAIPEDKERGILYAELFEEVHDASIAVAITSGELGPMLDVRSSFPTPETTVVGYNGDISVTFSGATHTLDNLREMVTLGMTELTQMTEDRYLQTHLGFEEKTLAIYSHHIVTALNRQMEPQLSDGQLRYDLEVSGSEFGLLMNFAVAQAALIFVDTLQDSLERSARYDLHQIESMVNLYYVSTNPPGLPDTLEDLTTGDAPMTTRLPLDPWGNEYIYRLTGDGGFEVFSAGRDGIEGTADDVHLRW